MKEQIMSLHGELRWISSDRQFADGLTKNQTRSLLADRLRRGQIKFIYDPDYVAAKNKTAKDREANKLEFSKRCSGATEPQSTQQSTNNHTQHKQDDDDDDDDDDDHEWMVDEEEPTSTTTRPMATPKYVQRILFAMMAFTLNKTALGETALVANNGDANEVLVNDTGTKVVDGDFINSMGWCILYMLAALCMLFGTILGYLYGKRASRLQKLAMQAEITNLTEEAEKWRKKWWDTDTDMAKALQELIDAKMAHEKEKKDLMDTMEVYKVELEQAEHNDAESSNARALLNRALGKIEGHLWDCPLNDRADVFMSPHGNVWHLQHDCHGLATARNVENKRPCTWCAVVPPPFQGQRPDTTLLEDLRDHIGQTSYESVIVG